MINRDPLFIDIICLMERLMAIMISWKPVFDLNLVQPVSCLVGLVGLVRVVKIDNLKIHRQIKETSGLPYVICIFKTLKSRGQKRNSKFRPFFNQAYIS